MCLQQLHQLHIVITRPAHQAGYICNYLEARGAVVSRLPLLEIKASLRPDLAIQKLNNIAAYQKVIFISTNAVHYGLTLGGPFFREQLWHNHELSVGAIGKSTAQTLAGYGVSVDALPDQDFNSEALLKLPAMQQVKGEKILIVRGSGGRALLAQTLTERGAAVDYADVYERCCPAPEAARALQQRHQNRPVDLVALTSTEALHNLQQLLQGLNGLQQLPLWVGGQRIADAARQAGFTADLIIAANPGDSAMLEALCAWQQEKK